jgi:hypothetical protein
MNINIQSKYYFRGKARSSKIQVSDKYFCFRSGKPEVQGDQLFDFFVFLLSDSFMPDACDAPSLEALEKCPIINTDYISS